MLLSNPAGAYTWSSVRSVLRDNEQSQSAWQNERKKLSCITVEQDDSCCSTIMQHMTQHWDTNKMCQDEMCTYKDIVMADAKLNVHIHTLTDSEVRPHQVGEGSRTDFLSPSCTLGIFADLALRNYPQFAAIWSDTWGSGEAHKPSRG